MRLRVFGLGVFADFTPEARIHANCVTYMGEGRERANRGKLLLRGNTAKRRDLSSGIFICGSIRATVIGRIGDRRIGNVKPDRN